MSAPLSRAVVLPHGSNVLIAGGLTSGDVSASGIFNLDPRTGALTPAGRLAQPLHDAAGAVLGARQFVFGGGAQATTANVQQLAANAGIAHVVGHLPQPRSDLVAAVLGNSAYVFGGYDGSATIGAVLRTTDGATFKAVGQLAIPVRYPAIAVTQGKFWLFGGEHNGAEIDAIQRFDPSTGRTDVVGHLPQPLSHESAVQLGGTIYLAGGRARGSVTDQVLAFHPANVSTSLVTRLPRPVADGAAIVVNDVGYLIGGENPQPMSIVTELHLVPKTQAAAAPTRKPAAAPFDGRLLIADRGNNRLILVDAAKHILWTFPSASAPPPKGGFYFPDDAFFVRNGTAIVSNEEENHAIVELAFPSGKLLWSYGHPGIAGSAPGYLDQPDDAYLLRNGNMTVADALNCRVLVIAPSGAVLGQIGTTKLCLHQPPHALGYPNGDTPLANGNVLISEINGSWISEYTLTGALVWTVHLPIAYPSDPQQLGPDRYLVADYARPGGLFEFDRAGHILWRYQPVSGEGMLDHPSLAEVLPSGLIGVNDDYRHRVVLINPVTSKIVWQYGVTDRAGTAAGFLNTPDGFDLLAPDGSTPTHPSTG